MGLSWYSGIPPGEIVLSSAARGKPFVTTPQGLHFNVSHSEGMGLVAFTRVGEVGIDVEAIDRRVDALEVASAYFSRTELAMVAELAGAAQVERFLRIWTRKEAVLKAAGTGVAGGVDRVDGSRDGVVVHLAEPGEPPTDWLIRDLAMPEGYVAAIATRPGEWDIEVWPNGRQVLPEILRKHFAGFE
jgi:4'-phosphopantetheinyl transferase